MNDAPAALRAALADRYDVGREIGAGGMGRVFLTDDLKHNRTVALKILRPELTDAGGGTRFMREIEIAAGLSHPHIVPLHDSGVAGGFPYYVMPHVEGGSLKALLQREGKLSVERAISIAADIADGLEYAHDHGFIHRDVKPGNVLLAGRNALVADFGVARALEIAGTSPITRTDVALGTPYYMSPEQFSDSHDVDVRSDIYSLGCVLFEMLTGRPPFHGKATAAVLAGHVQGEVPSMRELEPSVPVEVEAVVTRALAKDPRERFQSVAEVGGALSALSTGTHPLVKMQRGTSRTRVAAAVLTAVVVTSVVVATLSGGGGTLNLAGDDASVVVLPYADWTSTEEEVALVVDLADELTLQLNRWESVRAVPQIALAGISFDVRGRTGTFESLEEGLDVARAVNVRTLITVSGRLRGDTAMVTSSLYDVRSGRSDGRPIESTGAVEDPYRLASGVVHGILGLEGDIDEIEELRRQSAYPEALSRQAEGRDLLGSWRLEEAESAFRAAITIDSTFAMAHHYLALSLYWQAARDRTRLASLGPEIGRRALGAARHSGGTPPRDSMHIAAFHGFQEGDYEGARATYNDLIARDSTDVYALLLLGAVEFLDPWLVELQDGSHSPRSNWNVALRAFREAVRLSPGFHLGYGHLFDITREVLTPLEGGGSRAYELPRDEPLRPWEFSAPFSAMAFSPAAYDSIVWLERESYQGADRDLISAGADGLLRVSMRTLRRWAEFAPEEARPHQELAAWTIRDRARRPSPASPAVLDSLAGEALEHTARALSLRSDTLAIDLLPLANLQLATGDLEAAEATTARAEQLRASSPGSVPARSVSNIYLHRGLPRAALAIVDEERASQRYYPDPTSGELVDDGGVEPIIEHLRVLGATATAGPAMRDAFATLNSTWSPERYSPGALRTMWENTAPRLAVALWHAPGSADGWDLGDLGRDPIWALITERAEDAEALRAQVMQAASHADITVGGAPRAYVLSVAAQQAGMHNEAVSLAARGDSLAHSVTTRDPGWGLLTLSYLVRGRSLEALGQAEQAAEMYGRFLDVWADPDDLAPPLEEEAREALARIGLGS